MASMQRSVGENLTLKPVTIEGNPSIQPATQVILYYHLTTSELPAVQRAISGGIDVACLTADAAVMEGAADAVRFLGSDTLPYTTTVLETKAGIDLVEAVFKILASHSAILQWLHRLYGSPDIDHYFRRVLFNELQQFVCVASLAASSPLASYASIVLLPGWPRSSPLWSMFLNLWHQADTHQRLAAYLPQPVCAGFDRLSMANEPRQGGASVARRYLRQLYYVAATWYRVLRRLRPHARELPPARLLLRTYPTDMGVNSVGQSRLKNVDYVVDGEELPAEKVTIWVEPGVPEERRQALKQRGYRLLSADDIVIGLAAFVQRVMPVLLSYTMLLPRLVRADHWWHRYVATLVYNYLIWQEVCYQVKPAAFLAHNDMSTTGIARNIVLRQHNCCSVLCQHSCNWWILETDGEWAFDEDVYPYLVFDAIATWGSDHTDMIRRHPGAIGDYWEVGCLWSEHARLVRQDRALNQSYKQRLASHLLTPLDQYQRRVAVFDVSVSAMLSAHDLANFYAGIVRLARQLTDTLFILKPKVSIEHPISMFAAAGEVGEQVRRRIEESPNVVLLSDRFESAAVIELTDLTIGACFTSSPVETIGCGKRAIYYDPTNRFPNAFWRRIPGMVCVTDEELYERVRYLLWECDNEAYMQYLRTHLMGIEGYFDGRAITRLRRRLLQVMNFRQSIEKGRGTPPGAAD